MRKKKVWICLTVLFFAAVMQYEPPASGRASLAAGKSVGTQKELEQALETAGQMTISLRSDITVSKCLKVRGTKVVTGGGMYRIRRKSASGSTYKGTLLQMQGSILRLRDITLSGSGKSASVSGDINGKLIEIDSGTVVLESGTKLSANYNVSSLTDGGGGITVHAGGTAVMKPGSAIRDNLTVTGGSGVRVEAGGMFMMEGGTIADNVVLGQRKDTGFDGRGGAIHNRGIVMIQGGSITGNVAAGYEAGEGKYGGFGGAVYNQSTLTITGGTIKNNKGIFAGGAVYTNETGTVNIEGGQICDNVSEGQRGGGIYISAASTVLMEGGSITGNVAEDGTQIFLSSGSTGRFILRGGTVNGSQDAIYENGGTVSIQGGTVQSDGCALKIKGASEIRGGVLVGGEYGVKYCEGSLSISRTPRINSIYLREGQVIDTDKKADLHAACELCPERYAEGIKLVHLGSGQEPAALQTCYSLKKRGRYKLEAASDGLYIGREKYRIVFEANGGQGKIKEQLVYVDKKTALPVCTYWREGYAFVGWGSNPATVKRREDIRYRERETVKNLASDGETIHLYALWVKRPVITSGYEHLTFYEDENVDRDILLQGMQAVDECDGDISKRIEIVKIVLPDQTECAVTDRLPTKETEMGKGEIVYRVANSFDVRGEYRQMYEVIPNQKPECTVWDRYFFEGECSTDSAKKDILSGIRMKDEVETEEQLEIGRTVSWGGLDLDQAGEYQVTVRVTDQYGHRFYMRQGEEKQYGSGKSCEKTCTVYVVKGENDNTRTRKDGFVRFISDECVKTLDEDSIWRTEMYADELSNTFRKTESEYEEVWEISGDDKRKIKDFARQRENPFSQETNDLFLKKFSYMKEKGDGSSDRIFAGIR